MEKTVKAHLSRIRSHMAVGRDTLRSMHGTELTTYTVPGRTIAHLQPPQDSDMLGLVEQAVLACAAYFYAAHAMSSYGGDGGC